MGMIVAFDNFPYVFRMNIAKEKLFLRRSFAPQEFDLRSPNIQCLDNKFLNSQVCLSFFGNLRNINFQKVFCSASYLVPLCSRKSPNSQNNPFLTRLYQHIVQCSKSNAVSVRWSMILAPIIVFVMRQGDKFRQISFPCQGRPMRCMGTAKPVFLLCSAFCKPGRNSYYTGKWTASGVYRIQSAKRLTEME